MIKPLNIPFLGLFLCLIAPYPAISGNEGDDKDKKTNEVSISNLNLDSTGKMSWMTFHQNGALVFGVEQFLNNRWVKVGEVSSIAQIEQNTFTYAPHINSGENRFRLSWITKDKTRSYSNIVKTISKKEDVFFQVTPDNLQVVFTGSAFYIIYNPYGIIIDRGLGDKIDISRYKNGEYCISYDNKVAVFEKKTVWFKHSKHPIVRENKPERIKRAKKPFELSPP